MCDPATLAVMSLASTGISALGSVQQGRAQQDIANYNAQVAENQAIQARQKAKYDEDRQRRMARQVAGSQRATIAAMGGEAGDFGDVLSMSAEEAELDALAIRYGGQIAASAAQQQATLDRAEGRLRRQQGLMKAGSTLLTGGVSAGKLL